VIIQPIVEGQGEVDAVPVLLRRLRDEARAWGLEARPLDFSGLTLPSLQ